MFVIGLRRPQLGVYLRIILPTCRVLCGFIGSHRVLQRIVGFCRVYVALYGFMGFYWA